MNPTDKPTPELDKIEKYDRPELIVRELRAKAALIDARNKGGQLKEITDDMRKMAFRLDRYLTTRPSELRQARVDGPCAYWARYDEDGSGIITENQTEAENYAANARAGKVTVIPVYKQPAAQKTEGVTLNETPMQALENIKCAFDPDEWSHGDYIDTMTRFKIVEAALASRASVDVVDLGTLVTLAKETVEAFTKTEGMDKRDTYDAIIGPAMTLANRIVAIDEMAERLSAKFPELVGGRE